MGVEEVLAKLVSDRSVKAAFHLNGEFYKKVIDEESSVIESSMGMPLVNRALQEVVKRKVAVCLFCYGDFETPSDHVMVLEDGIGNVVGHDVPACMMDRFKDDPEIFWLCDDFAVYPNRAASVEMLMVMLPLKVKFVGHEEGAKDPVLLYPATTTDILLRGLFGISMDEPIASAILAFDPM
jgi:hypothetical protein